MLGGAAARRRLKGPTSRSKAGHTRVIPELSKLSVAERSMSDTEEKLRFLARQTRQLSRAASDRNHSRMLRSLAELYERQAAELDEPALLAGKSHGEVHAQPSELVNL